MSYPKIKIGEIAKVKGGKRLPKGYDFAKEETNHPYIRARDIRDGIIRLDDPVYIDEEVFEKIRRYTVKTNDVCIVIVGANVGDVGIVPHSLNCANLTENAIKLTELRDDYDSIFLKYSLLTEEPKHQMKLFAAGAAQPKLGIYKINDIEISFPKFTVQRKIASILSAYDDLIENNNRRIKILEEMAQTIYKEWFVNFRFPGHEKAKMVKSELGMIPEGWEVKKLGEVIELAYGKALKKDDRREGRFPVYGSGGICGYHNELLVEGPGIIVGRKGNVGSVFWSEKSFYPIDTVYYVKSVVELHYLYFNLLSQNFINTDAAVPGLNRNQAYKNKLLIPLKNVMDKFALIIKPVFNYVELLKNKNENLRKTRDLLLPKLISGEINIKAINIIPEER